MMYQTVLIENITPENVTEKINAKLIERCWGQKSL